MAVKKRWSISVSKIGVVKIVCPFQDVLLKLLKTMSGENIERALSYKSAKSKVRSQKCEVQEYHLFF